MSMMPERRPKKPRPASAPLKSQLGTMSFLTCEVFSGTIMIVKYRLAILLLRLLRSRLRSKNLDEDGRNIIVAAVGVRSLYQFIDGVLDVSALEKVVLDGIEHLGVLQ